MHNLFIFLSTDIYKRIYLHSSLESTVLIGQLVKVLSWAELCPKHVNRILLCFVPLTVSSFLHLRLAKSTLTLIPLLGIHQVVFIFVTDESTKGTIGLRLAKLFVDLFFSSFQVVIHGSITYDFQWHIPCHICNCTSWSITSGKISWDRKPYKLFNKSVGLKFAGEIRKVDICLIDGESLGTVPVVRQFVSSGACER